METKKSKKKTIQFVLIGIMVVLIAAAFIMLAVLGGEKEKVRTYEDYISEGDKSLESGDKLKAYDNYKTAFGMETENDKTALMYKIFSVTESEDEKLLMAYKFLDNAKDDEIYKDDKVTVLEYVSEYNDINPGNPECIYLGSYPQRAVTSEEIIGYLKSDSVKFDEAGFAEVHGKKYAKIEIMNEEKFFTVDKIAWDVLSVEDGKKVLVSTYVLDCEVFMEEMVESSWDISHMREWLSTEFSKTAFTDDEFKMLELMHVKNPFNQCYGYADGEDVDDYITLFACDELINEKYGFNIKDNLPDEKRVAKCSDYASEKGVFHDDDMNAKWWTIANGSMSTSYVCVNTNGVVAVGGELCTNKNIGVRPVITISE